MRLSERILNKKSRNRRKVSGNVDKENKKHREKVVNMRFAKQYE